MSLINRSVTYNDPPKENTMAYQFIVKAKENSVSGGVPMATGIAVHPGQLLTISVSPDDTWSAGAANRTSNANGLGNPLGGNFGTFTKNGFVYLFGCLVGSFDEGRTFFPVGTRLEMTILGPGKLSLFYWDSNNQDNSGEVTATVALYTGPLP
jgi:hypothetical protein